MKSDSDITNQLKKKYESIDQDLEVHLEGLLHSKPISYWDYIQTDVLLNLQKPRTPRPTPPTMPTNRAHNQTSPIKLKVEARRIENCIPQSATPRGPPTPTLNRFRA